MSDELLKWADDVPHGLFCPGRFPDSKDRCTCPRKTTLDLASRVRELEADRDLWADRCIGTALAIPDDTLCGTVQESVKAATQLRERAERAEAELATERALFREFQVKGIPMKYKRMEFNARLQKENEDLRAERDALRAVLRDLMIGVEDDCGEPDCDDCIVWRPARAALAGEKL